MSNDSKHDFRPLESAARAAATLSHHAGHPALQWPLVSPRGPSARVGKTADGCYVVDQSGRQLVDWTGSPHGRLIGYRHPVMIDAISRWVNDEAASPVDRIDSHDGPLVDQGLADVAHVLPEFFPGNQVVAMCESRDMAIRRAIEIARSVTRRPTVLFVSQCQQPDLSYQPPIAKMERQQFGGLVDNVGVATRLSFNHIDAIRDAIESAADSLAAIFIEPFRYATPHSGFFPQLIEALAASVKTGTPPLLIVDESSTAFRIAQGGAQQYFEFAPDLTIVGESLAGPCQFSAVLAEESWVVGEKKNSLTDATMPAGMPVAVVNATLQHLSALDLPARLLAVGEEVRENFRQSCANWKLSGRLLGHASRLMIRFDSVGELNGQQILQRFCYAAMQHGVLTFGELWPSGALTDEAVEQTVCALESAAAETSQWLASMQSSSVSSGSPYQYFIKGRVDSLNMVRKSLLLNGWLLVDDQPLDRLSAIDERGIEHDAERVQRPDLSAGFPDIANVASAGFRLSVPIDSVKQTSRFMLRGYRGDDVVYQTFFVHDPSLQTSGPYPFSSEALLT